MDFLVGVKNIKKLYQIDLNMERTSLPLTVDNLEILSEPSPSTLLSQSARNGQALTRIYELISDLSSPVPNPE